MSVPSSRIARTARSMTRIVPPSTTSKDVHVGRYVTGTTRSGDQVCRKGF